MIAASLPRQIRRGGAKHGERRLPLSSTLRSASPRLTEHRVVLLGHPDERGSPAELFELGSPNIGTGGAQSSEDIQNCVLHISFVRHFHGLALRGPEEGKKKGKEE